jgi:hypothetical protein
MTGDKALKELRRLHRIPRCVWVMDSDDFYAKETALTWCDHRNVFDREFHAHIRVEAHDMPEALDLRCVVGLECHLAGDRSSSRTRRLFQALIEAGAAKVVALADGEVLIHEKATQ